MLMKYLYSSFCIFIYKKKILKQGFNGYLPYRNNFDVFVTNIFKGRNDLSEFSADRKVDSWAKVKKYLLREYPQFYKSVQHKGHSFSASKIRQFNTSASVQQTMCVS